MADSSVTTGAAGAVMDTRTESVNGDHRQVVCLGDVSVGGQVARVGTEGGLFVTPRGGQRSVKTLNVQGYSVTATDTLLPFIQVVDGVAAGSTATSFTVTTGYNFRIQALFLSVVLLGTTVTATRVTLRDVVSSGTLGATSPALASFRMGNASIGTQAANYGIEPQMIEFPDGLELTGGMKYGLSAVATTAAMHSLDATLIGYEYPA